MPLAAGYWFSVGELSSLPPDPGQQLYRTGLYLSLPTVHAHKINQAEGDYVGKAPNYVNFKWVEMVKGQSQQFLT